MFKPSSPDWVLSLNLGIKKLPIFLHQSPLLHEMQGENEGIIKITMEDDKLLLVAVVVVV